MAGTVPVLAQRAVSEGQEGEQPDHPSCSQNAHDTTVLVRCAQGRTVWLFPLRTKWGKSEDPRPGSWHVSACQWVGG